MTPPPDDDGPVSPWPWVAAVLVSVGAVALWRYAPALCEAFGGTRC